MTVKEFLKAAHTHANSVMLHESKRRERISELHARRADALEKSDNDEVIRCDRGLAEAYKSGASQCSEEAGYHSQMAVQLDAMSDAQPYKASKAAGVSEDRDFSKMVPTEVVGIIPDAAQVRAVTRVGQPQLQQQPNVSVQFQDLVKIPGDDED